MAYEIKVLNLNDPDLLNKVHEFIGKTFGCPTENILLNTHIKCENLLVLVN